ncbi:MAG: CDP-glycerol glycerophosphotransferase family protein [Gemmatimonadaceae bacterium]|jgi:CDP-glycerol glycerophosphotransferase (TagB/SpsB family)|nr:CDP-glycerol glycerophosphotransferase family protein [Gemmatimonadaceae bacterium]
MAKPHHAPARAAEKPADPYRDLESRVALYEFAELSAKVSKRPLVLFFGRQSFCDNTKYLYLHLVESNPGYEVLWCTWHEPVLRQLRGAGLPCFDLRADMASTIKLLLAAATVVCCENPFAAFAMAPELVGCIEGARKIQLWHGISVKHLDLMLVPHMDTRDLGFRTAIRYAMRADHLLSPASALDDFWVRAFGCTSLVRAGLPRNEVIVREPSARELLGAELPAAVEAAVRDTSRRKILLTPTWQRGQALYVSTPAFYERLARWAQANDAVVIGKTHPFLQHLPLPGTLGEHLHFVGGGVDLYPWMSHMDAMITDYSSIMFDFLLTNRPIFTFDSRTQVSYGFEPDWSLVPDHAFRYAFDQSNMDAVLDANLTSHPLAASQRTMQAALYETNPASACAELAQLVTHCTSAGVQKTFDVIHPEPGAARAA